MPWLQAKLRLPQQLAEQVEQACEALGALSITLEDAEDQPLLEPGPGETPLWSQSLLTALFDADQDPELLQLALRQALLPLGLATDLRLERLEDQAWERAWMDHFRPMRFGRRLWVCPSGQRVEAADACVVDLDPGLAFGTGTHPTTALCLEYLDQLDLHGCRLIDFGCGSGILAIAALKLGAHRAVGLDHDPQALQASRDNALRNDVSDRLELIPPGGRDPAPAELVLANILAGVLIELAPRILGLVSPGGRLVLSGILVEQLDAVADAYREQIEFEAPRIQEGWVLLAGTRR